MSFGDGFLRLPDLFPGRRGGEPWGERAVVLDVAGGPYLFSGLSAAQDEAVRRRFAGLCRDGTRGDRPAVTARLFRAPAADFLDRDLRGWEYTLDMEHAPGAVCLAGLRLMARLDWTAGGSTGGPAGGLAGGLWTCEGEGEEWISVFENFFRVLAAYRLAAAGGAMLHSAGVTDGEAGFLLLGPSGAGKTTASRLCLEQGAQVLSDDLNAVGFDAAKARLRKLPFTGDLGERAGARLSVPLRAVLRLVKGNEEALRPLSPAAALAGLVAAAPFVNHDPHRREALLAVLERLARAVPAYAVTFAPRGRLWAILRTVPR
jgi:hypothetical protein